jgi:hypothetical protein
MASNLYIEGLKERQHRLASDDAIHVAPREPDRFLEMAHGFFSLRVILAGGLKIRRAVPLKFSLNHPHRIAAASLSKDLAH